MKISVEEHGKVVIVSPYGDIKVGEGDVALRDAIQKALGEGKMHFVLDLGEVRCSSMASMYCGSGGCSLHAVIGERSWLFQAEDWKIVEWDGQRILLVARDGGWCGGAGAQLCFEAIVWSNGEMLTVMPQP